MADKLEDTRLKMELNRLRIIGIGAGSDLAKGLLYRKRFFNEDFKVKNSALGTAVYTNLKFNGGSFTPLGGGIPVVYGTIFIDTVLMTVSQTKNIVTTQIQGKSGTVKEYVSDGDFQIDVKGIIVSSGENDYPSFDVEQLMTIFTIPDAISVTSEFLGHFGVASPKGLSGIDEVVITDFSFPQLEGFRNQQPFTCKMISDSPIELII